MLHLAELCFQLECHRLHVVCIQEFWLDEGSEEFKISGYVVVYVVVSCTDRYEGINKG